MLSKIISGGQTGADQAALDAAIELGIPQGGWIPKGRLTEAGTLPEKYNLTEMPTKAYLKRTRQNVLDSDGTVIFSHGELKGGSKRTADFATELRKPSSISISRTPRSRNLPRCLLPGSRRAISVFSTWPAQGRARTRRSMRWFGLCWGWP